MRRHEPPRPPPWWWEAWAITRAILSILFWPLMSLTALVVTIGGLVVAFAVHWAWGLVAVGLTATAVALALWWGRGRLPPC
jgi:lysylphosphatidylglycerol synthetase-like protein (DUF2156 family)